MDILIAYILGLFAGGSFDDKINVSAVGCNPIVQNLRHEQFVQFIQMIGIIFAFYVAFILFLIWFDSVVRNYRLMKRGY